MSRRALVALAMISGRISPNQGKIPHGKIVRTPGVQLFQATYYGPNFDGKTMANGEPFDMTDPTIAAHRTLPFGTKLTLRNPKEDRTLQVIIKDRMGPEAETNQIDLSVAAAKKLRFDLEGRAELEILSRS